MLEENENFTWCVDNVVHRYCKTKRSKPERKNSKIINTGAYNFHRTCNAVWVQREVSKGGRYDYNDESSAK